MTPSEVFEQRQTVFLQQAEVFQRRYSQLSAARLSIFLATIALTWGLSRINSTTAFATGLIGLVSFVIVLRKHQKTARQRDLYRALAEINKDEISRLSLHFSRTETGETFAVKNHAYCNDLDVLIWGEFS